MQIQTNLLIGKRVSFKMSATERMEGIVVAEELIKESLDKPVTTGYAIQLPDGYIKHIGYWRLDQVLHADGGKTDIRENEPNPEFTKMPDRKFPSNRHVQAKEEWAEPVDDLPF